MSEFIGVEHRGTVCESRLARSDKRNAITDAMYAALADALAAADANPAVAVVIVRPDLPGDANRIPGAIETVIAGGVANYDKMSSALVRKGIVLGCKDIQSR